VSAIAPLRGPPESVPIVHETSERVVRAVVFALPPAALLIAGWLAWGGTLHWHDLIVLAITYTLSGLGITVGFHRLFTHRSFRTTRAVRALLAHAHVGWMFRGKDMGNPARYAKDLLADRDMRFISRTFPLWVAIGMLIPFGLGIALTGSLTGGLTGLLWGGAVRVLLLHHVTFSINSLCHFFGRRPYATGDESRNLAWLAPIAFGEAWHNNHHAFPTSARHGLGLREIDPGAWLITALERCHLAWDVVRISPGHQQAKRGPAVS